MPRRKSPYRSPDGLDWRDPNMKLVRDYTFQNGRKITEVDPEFETQWREHCMNINTAPTWRNDPLYNANRRRRNGR